MLPLLLMGVVFFFLLCGSIVFLVLLPLRNTRQYALSAALWCAAWGPCTCSLIFLAVVGLLATAYAPKAGDKFIQYGPKLLSTFGFSYAIVGVLLTIGVASAVAWLHQAIINRLPSILFRLYATLVVAGMGSVFGWSFSLWSSASGPHGNLALVRGILIMLVLVLGFGAAGFKLAKGLRTTPEHRHLDNPVQTLFAGVDLS